MPERNLHMKIEKIRTKGRGLVQALLFPRRCPVCGEIVSEPGRLFCGACQGALPYIRGPRCRKCGKQLREEAKGLCRSCEKYERRFRLCLCLLNYDGLTSAMMARKEYAEGLGFLLYKHLGTQIRLLRPEALVPVPIHRRRRKKRGYNQAEAIAVALAAFLNGEERALSGMGLSPGQREEIRDLWRQQEQQLLGLYRLRQKSAPPVPKAPGKGKFLGEALALAAPGQQEKLWEQEAREAVRQLYFQKIEVKGSFLIRRKNTKAQKELSAVERLLNLQAAFAPGREAAPAERILLVDDIYTTGATLEACTMALLSAGVRQVYGLCVCAGADV